MAKEAEIAAQRAKAGLKMAKDVMSEAMNYFGGLATKFQPDATTGLFREPEHEQKFERYLSKAADIAKALAQYESPRMQSITYRHDPIDLSKLNDRELAELDRLLAAAALADGTSGRPRGAVTTTH